VERGKIKMKEVGGGVTHFFKPSQITIEEYNLARAPGM
jgi:hypothetical protein